MIWSRLLLLDRLKEVIVSKSVTRYQNLSYRLWEPFVALSYSLPVVKYFDYQAFLSCTYIAVRDSLSEV